MKLLWALQGQPSHKRAASYIRDRPFYRRQLPDVVLHDLPEGLAICCAWLQACWTTDLVPSPLERPPDQTRTGNARHAPSPVHERVQRWRADLVNASKPALHPANCLAACASALPCPMSCMARNRALATLPPRSTPSVKLAMHDLVLAGSAAENGQTVGCSSSHDLHECRVERSPTGVSVCTHRAEL